MRFRYFLIASMTLTTLAAAGARAQAAGAAGAAVTAGAAVMVPGLWEITVQTVSPILAAPLTHTVCIDKMHVTKPEPPKSKAHDDCQVLPEAAASNQTAYTVHCAKKNVTSTSRFTYSGDHFDGTVTIKSAGGEVQQVFTAVRLSDCDDDLPVSAAPPAH